MKGHPAWYGAVMGTGAVALALSVQAVTWEAGWLRALAQVFLVLASVLAVVLPHGAPLHHDRNPRTRPALRPDAMPRVRRASGRGLISW